MRKSTIKLIAIILGVVLCLGAVGFGVGLIKLDEDKQDEMFGKKVNENNIYTVECMTLTDMNDGNGVTIDVDEKRGGILLNGTATKDMEFTVGTVSLKEGVQYTFTALESAGRSTIYVVLDTGTEDIYSDFTPSNTFDQVVDTDSALIIINIKEGTELDNVWVLPVIVEGDTAESFYTR